MTLVMFQVVSVADRPDLLPAATWWRWESFFRHRGRTYESLLAEAEQTAAAAQTLPQTLVLLADAEPVGTASLAAQDLEERPDLTPWLAGVVVAPAWRGRGLAGRLIAAVETLAAASGHHTLWLYTGAAERVYARAGWRRVEIVQHRGAPVVLMRRELAGQVGPA